MTDNTQDTQYKQELKIQALNERIAEMTQEYENKVADLRVNYTISQATVENKDEEIKQLKLELEAALWAPRPAPEENNPEVTEVPTITTLSEPVEN